MKKRISLTESDLHKIVNESVNKVLKEVSLKGKSGGEYSLHGDNFDSWGTLAKLRKHQMNTPNRIMTGREKDAYKRDDDNSTDLMIDHALMNNIRGRAADRLMDIADKTSDYISKDIINNYDPKVESKQHNGNKHTVRLSESDLHRIVKESVNRILNENGIDDAKRKKNADRRNKMMQKYNRFNDGSNNPYSDEGRYYRHLETEPR